MGGQGDIRSRSKILVSAYFSKNYTNLKYYPGKIEYYYIELLVLCNMNLMELSYVIPNRNTAPPLISRAGIERDNMTVQVPYRKVNAFVHGIDNRYVDLHNTPERFREHITDCGRVI